MPLKYAAARAACVPSSIATRSARVSGKPEVLNAGQNPQIDGDRRISSQSSLADSDTEAPACDRAGRRSSRCRIASPSGRATKHLAMATRTRLATTRAYEVLLRGRGRAARDRRRKGEYGYEARPPIPLPQRPRFASRESQDTRQTKIRLPPSTHALKRRSAPNAKWSRDSLDATRAAELVICATSRRTTDHAFERTTRGPALVYWRSAT
ncbi:hypothetical protein FB451DRAFT_1408359 [Mycena latifolia]|nr:hypothetical protein FB451DRAFT_1408359 [Mycena latifolia]